MDTHAPDPRHLRRAALMQAVFAYGFYEGTPIEVDYQSAHQEIAQIVPLLAEIDGQLQQFAPERPLSQINKVDLAILRTVMFEWKTTPTPKKVLIDEAVELAKEFGTESSSRFVNGVLAHMMTKE